MNTIESGSWPAYSARAQDFLTSLRDLRVLGTYRWPPDVVLRAVRWYCRVSPSAAQAVRLLAERHIDVTARTVLNWVQTFGPQLAAALRTHRRRVGQKWTADEVVCFRGGPKLYLYRAVDEHGDVIDVLLRDNRTRSSAEAFFRQSTHGGNASGTHD